MFCIFRKCKYWHPPHLPLHDPSIALRECVEMCCHQTLAPSLPTIAWSFYFPWGSVRECFATKLYHPSYLPLCDPYFALGECVGKCYHQTLAPSPPTIVWSFLCVTVEELVTICTDPYQAAKQAHALVICTEWDEFDVSWTHYQTIIKLVYPLKGWTIILLIISDTVW